MSTEEGAKWNSSSRFPQKMRDWEVIGAGQVPAGGNPKLRQQLWALCSFAAFALGSRSPWWVLFGFILFVWCSCAALSLSEGSAVSKVCALDPGSSEQDSLDAQNGSFSGHWWWSLEFGALPNPAPHSAAMPWPHKLFFILFINSSYRTDP